MKSISTGTGLLGLSVTIATCFAIAHFDSEPRALAAPTKGIARTAAMLRGLPPTMATRPSPEQDPFFQVQEREAGLPRIAADASCLGEPEQWFDPTPKRVPEDCSNLITFPMLTTVAIIGPHVDVDGDGFAEWFYMIGGQASLRQVLIDGVAASVGPVLAVGQYQLANEESTFTAVPVFVVGAQVGQTALQFIMADPELSRWEHHDAWAWIVPEFRDMDGDGALDNVGVLYLNGYGDNGEGIWKIQRVWFKNIGHTRPPPANPFDLDHDGHVNNADLSLLLMEFTD